MWSVEEYNVPFEHLDCPTCVQQYTRSGTTVPSDFIPVSNECLYTSGSFVPEIQTAKLPLLFHGTPIPRTENLLNKNAVAQAIVLVPKTSTLHTLHTAFIVELIQN